jgi:hypothetical protein
MFDTVLKVLVSIALVEAIIILGFMSYEYIKNGW